MITNFKPTRLYIKELAGVKYFGKSIGTNIEGYTGSGIVWKCRIKKYGKENIRTLWISDWYHDPHEVMEVALHFSKENNIVESEEWANLKPENGLEGGHPGTEGCKKISEGQIGRVPWNKGKSMWSEEERKLIGIRNSQRGPQSAETIKKRVDKNTGKKRTEEQKRNLGRSKKGRSLTEAHKETLRGKRPHVVAHNRDNTIYTFVHMSGKEETLTRHDMCKLHGLCGQNLTAVIQGKRRSHKGWSLKP